MQDKKQQLEPDMEDWPISKLGKKCIEAVCFHAAHHNDIFQGYTDAF